MKGSKSFYAEEHPLEIKSEVVLDRFMMSSKQASFKFNPFVENINFIKYDKHDNLGNISAPDKNINCEFIVKTKTLREKLVNKKNQMKSYDPAGLVDVKKK